MCYREHLIKYYDCGATTGRINLNTHSAVNVQESSSSRWVQCTRGRAVVERYRAYTTRMNAAHIPLLGLRDWARNYSREPACYSPTVYTATWRTTRECRTGGVNGVGVCARRGQNHPYVRARGVFD
ncbi:hypothetical protein FPV67DRAFT_2815 [Lyophyllum atratum]|nr:hypothetical protein FPV67DRAFT_2815 [Lyophyllum atratum]